MNHLLNTFNVPQYPTMVLRNIEDKDLGFIVEAKDIQVTLNFNAPSEITFEIPKEVNSVAVPLYEQIKSKFRVYILDLNMVFVIREIEEVYTGIETFKTVRLYSLETEIDKKTITLLKGTYCFYDPVKPQDTVLGKAMAYLPDWTIGTVDSDLWTQYRTFDVITRSLYQFMMTDLEQTYGCVFIYDTVKRLIHVKTTKNVVKKTNIMLKYSSIVNEIKLTESDDRLVSALNVFGGGELSINLVNPLGTSVIYDYSAFLGDMSEPLRVAVIAWQTKVKDTQVVYGDILSTLQVKNTEMLKLKIELTELESDFLALEGVLKQMIDERQTGSDAYTEKKQEADNKQADIDLKKEEIKSKQSEIDAVREELKVINLGLQFSNNFTPDQLIALSSYTVYADHTNENFISTASMNDKERQDMAQGLYDQATAVLAKLVNPRLGFTMSANNFLFLDKFNDYRRELEMPCQICVEMTDDLFAYPVLVNLSYSYDEPSSLSLGFGSKLRPNSAEFDYEELFNESSKTDSSVKIDSAKWNEWIDSGVSGAVSDFLQNGLNTAKQQLMNSNNQEITINEHGLRAKRFIPESESYSPKQIWMTSNNICITDDAFNTVKTALGEVMLSDGETVGFGLLAEIICGKLICGNKLLIESDDASVLIDGTGILVKNGHFKLEDTKGMAFIQGDKITLPNAGMSNEGESPSSIRIYAGKSWEERESAPFRVQQDGKLIAQNADIKGKIVATEGEFSGKITLPKAGMANDGYGSNAVRIYAGDEYDNRTNADFRVLEDGTVIAKKAEIEGKVIANEGVFTGTIHADSGDFKGSVNCDELYIRGQNVLTGNNKIDGQYIENLHIEGNLSANIAQLESCWNKDLFVERLQTNFDDWIFGKNNVTERNYIKMEKESIQMIHENLSTTTYQFLQVNNKQVYFLKRFGNEADDWYTYVHPFKRTQQWKPNVFYEQNSVVLYSNSYYVVKVGNYPQDGYDSWSQASSSMHLVVVDDFKVKVKEVLSSNVKFATEFKNIVLSNGTSTKAPVMVFGAGYNSDVTNNSGKGIMYKDADGMVLKYFDRNNTEVSIKFTDSGIKIVNPFKGGLHNSHIFSSPPTEEEVNELDEYDIVYVLGGQTNG